MRVRVLKQFSAYWNYAITQFNEGAEADGELARHLVDNAPKDSVEVVEADPEPEDVPEAPQDPEVPVPPDGDEPPVDETIDVLMTWVGDDKERAGRALAAEQAKDKPRSTVVKRLADLAGSEE
jgi:hypothetical protein